MLFGATAPAWVGSWRRTMAVGAGALAGGILLAGAWTYVVPREIRTEIIVDGSTEQVWSVLTDVAEYPAWNPAIVALDGSLEPGETVEVHLVAGGSELVFRPVVQVVEPGRELRWLGRLPGVFEGTHSFVLEPVGDRRTRLLHGERFSGIAAPFFPLGDTRRAFEAMNDALAQRVAADDATR